MQMATLTDFRQNMKDYFERVFTLGTPLYINRPKGKDMVIMSKDEYESMQETFHLSKSPKNAIRLLSAIEQDQLSQGEVKTLLED
jgi:antitoxin YefM